MPAYLNLWILFVSIGLIGTQLTGAKTQLQKVCCDAEQVSGQIYNYETMRFYHFGMDFKKQRSYVTEDLTSHVFYIEDSKEEKLFYFNGTKQCYYEPLQLTEIFPQCLYALPENIHKLKISVPQGDVDVTAVSIQAGVDKVVRFVNTHDATGLCTPIATTGAVTEFYSHIRWDIGDHAERLNTDVSGCVEKTS